MTNTVTMFPMVGALKIAYEFKDQAKGPWCSKNEDQAIFLKEVYEIGCKELNSFPTEEMEYLASFSYTELNQWLKDNGFDIQLDPFEDPTDFGAASIMDVLVKWVTEGIKSKVEHAENGKEYDAVTLNSNGNKIEFFENKKVHPHPIAQVETKNGDIVCMTIADGSCDGLDLLQKVSKLSKIEDYTSFENLIFPMIDLDQQPDISWLKGMFFDGVSAVDGLAGEMTIKQAKQQTRFKMNHEGARVKSAVAIGMMRCASVRMPKPPMVIDRPYFLWIMRNGVTVPYFAAYLSEDSWKDPGSLKMPGDKKSNDTQELDAQKIRANELRNQISSLRNGDIDMSNPKNFTNSVAKKL